MWTRLTPNVYWIVMALAASTAIKLLLAIWTVGTNDVVTWLSFVRIIQQFGGTGVYRVSSIYGDPFNHPPFMVHVLRLLSFVSDQTRLPFPWVLKLPAILADIGSVLLVYRLSKVNVVRSSVLAITVLALSPVSILVSGFHGNTDPVMVFFMLLAIYLLEVKQFWWVAGIAFGMAINIKVVPLIFVPAIFFNLREWRSRITFFLSATLTVLICWMPFLAEEPFGIVRNTLGYKGFPAAWGFSNLMSLFDPSQRPMFYALLRALIIASGVLLPLWLRKRGANLFTQFGAIILVFYFLTTALGVQYVAWAVPFVLTLGIGWATSYYLSAGVLLFSLYNYWSHGTWYYADSHQQPSWNFLSSMLAYVCWMLIGLMLIRYRHVIQDGTLSKEQSDDTSKECVPVTRSK